MNGWNRYHSRRGAVYSLLGTKVNMGCAVFALLVCNRFFSGVN